MNIALSISKVLYLGGGILGANSGNVTVLCYHALDHHNKYSVSPALFKRQILALRRTHTFVPLDEYMNGKRLSPKKNYVVLTFDDGYRSVLQVKDFLKSLNITPALFILSDTHNVQRHELDHKGDLLSWDEIRELQSEGWIIGSHGATHSDFLKITRSELLKEIYGSKKALEEKIGQSIQYFAYPKGMTSPYVKRLVKDAGYKAAFGTAPLNIKRGKARYEMPRFVVERSYPADSMHIKIAKSTLFARRIFDRTVFIIS